MSLLIVHGKEKIDNFVIIPLTKSAVHCWFYEIKKLI